MVRYVDGSVLAQMGNPDMRTPIAHAMAYPDRIEAGVAPLDLTQVAQLQFYPVEHARFPCLQLAFDALRHGGCAPAILNAANEVAVAAFLNNELSYRRIAEAISDTMNRCAMPTISTLDDLLSVDVQARQLTRQFIAQRTAA
jgi:1-deoxy-D-xylulose-5-phosphate reductoisomerase